MKIKQWVLAAALIISGLGVLASCEKFEEANQDILCQWICDSYDETAEPGQDHNRFVEVYTFFENGTGYYEGYALKDDELVYVTYVRGENGNFRYEVDNKLDLQSVAQKNPQVYLNMTIYLLDRSWSPWTVHYYDGRIYDSRGGVFTPATEAQQAMVRQWYESRNVIGLSEKIIGKWMPAELDGKPVLTDKKSVYTFVSATKAYMSVSTNPQQGEETVWNDQKELDVAISGNTMTLTNHSDEHTTMVEEFSFTAISGSEFTANHKLTVKVDGSVVLSNEGVIRFEKTTADYTADILGLWECTGLTGIETYNDANARLEFLADGTYRYYRKNDGGEWEAVSTREFQNYFVDGTLLATRWKNQGDEELREWWEIASLADGEMQWTALRQNADGSTAQQGMTWKKIDLNIPEKIIGKWIIADKNGHPELTNVKFVYTFISSTKAYVSASFNSHPEIGSSWHDQVEVDVVISGNTVTLTNHPDEHGTVMEEYTISAINDIEFTANQKITITFDGAVVITEENVCRFTKVTTDYSADILGTWEGQVTSTQDTYGDGKEHRWEYKADGKFVYYVKNGDEWVPSANTLNEYFVDGNLLCMRWVDNGVEYREWWEISIADGKMNWSALRQNPDGTTFTATFSMTKVQ